MRYTMGWTFVCAKGNGGVEKRSWFLGGLVCIMKMKCEIRTNSENNKYTITKHNETAKHWKSTFIQHTKQP